MKRAVRMCEGCPFRAPISRAERIELAQLTPDEFPCHTEAGYTETDIQCRGHWQVRQKFGRADHRQAKEG
jgi:hypothetical protein